MNITKLLKMHDVKFNMKKYDLVNETLPTASGGGVAEFLDHFKDESEILEALDQLNYFLNGGVYNVDYESISIDLYTAVIDMEANVVGIYDNSGSGIYDSFQNIPVLDFKDILEEWLKFLKKNYY